MRLSKEHPLPALSAGIERLEAVVDVFQFSA